MADLGNRANVNSAIDLLLDDLQPDEAIQPSDHNVLLKDILDTLANGLSTVLRTGNTTDGQNLTITSSSIFQFSNGSNGRLQSDTLTAFRNWTLPDTTGTIALLSDIPSADNIYTANGTLTGDRTVDLDGNKLTFDFDQATTTEQEPINFEFGGGFGGYYSRWDDDGGLIIKSASTYALNVLSKVSTTDSMFYVKKEGGVYLHADKGAKIITISSSPTSNKKFEFDDDRFSQFFGGVEYHRMKLGGSGTGVHFFQGGISGSLGRFIVGNSLPISTEDISLQGSTAIKGNGTSTGSALSIYDNDTTPTKLWDFLDNGNVNLGVDSVINQDSNVLQFSNINSIGGLKFNGTSNNGIGLNLANGSNDFDFVVAGSSNTLIGTGSLGLLIGGAWGMQIKQNREISIGTNFEPVAGYDLSVDKAYFDTEITVKSPAGIMQFNGYRTNVVNPSTPTFPNDKDFGLHKNTATGRCFLGYNDGGTIKFVQLTTSGVPNPSVQETTSTATFTINADEETTGVLTAMASATTIASPTGTPVQGQSLIIRLKDDGTARAITWNAIFRGIGITLPTTTTANKLLYIGCMYNSTDTKWDIIALKEEA